MEEMETDEDEIEMPLKESPPTPIECLAVSEESPAETPTDQWVPSEPSLLAKALMQIPVMAPEVICEDGNDKSENSLTIQVKEVSKLSDENADIESSIASEELKIGSIESHADVDASKESKYVSEPKSPEILESVETEVTPKEGGSSDKMSSFRMQMGKAEIERMINDGTLEKVSDRFYKVKANTIQELKTAGTPLPLNVNEGTTSTVKAEPLSKKVKAMKALNLASATTANDGSSFEDPIENSTNSTQIMIQNVQQTVSPNAPVIQQQQQPASYIALVPVNQSQNKNTLIAVQQNPNYNPNLPTFLALPQTISVNNSSSIVADSNQIINISGESSVVSQSHFATAGAIENNPSLNPTPCLRPSTVKTKANATPYVAASASVTSGVKRKPQFEDTKVRRPYKYAKPLQGKKKNISKSKNYVSDLNSSEEDEGEEKVKIKVLGRELASMFFKTIGEPKAIDKSLLDKLHNTIFEDSHLNSESESEPENSDTEEDVMEILSNDNAYQMVTCPGPGKIEAFVGPGNNSKLTIIRSNETKAVKSFLYEVYRVRVASLGREANTNILIPIPEGYKFKYPLRAREEAVEFSHLPHDDASIYNQIHPKFLEELASTQLKLRKYKDEIKVLRGRYLELLQEYANRPQFSTISDLVGASAKFLTDDQLVFFLMQLKAGAHNMQNIRYSVREKVLALSIYQKSPEMYKWFRRIFNLPSKRILDQWLEDIGSQDPQLLKKLMYHIYTTYNYKSVS